MLTWELLGAAVGAGLASGREITAFFGQYEAWGFAGIALAAGTIALLADARMPPSWRGRWPEGLWCLLNALLLAVTAGAMLAGAGEITAMALPGARYAGMAATLLLAWLIARRTQAGLAWVSRVLLAGLAALLIAGAVLPGQGSAGFQPDIPEGLMRGVAYGGFNAALMQPLLAACGLPDGQRKRSLRWMCALLACLLAAGLAVLRRHSEATGAAMPLLEVAGRLGGPGAVLSGACLYLAVLSTMAACLRVLRGWWVAGIAAVALLGFAGVVDAAYPLLGGVCAAMLAAMRAANLLNSCRNTFHSRRGVL
ncbi:MAG: hypothetical protein IJE07_05985 [Clostridia bacterium]|nr:hypothetical protein [Clostridia bacterium]